MYIVAHIVSLGLVWIFSFVLDSLLWYERVNGLGNRIYKQWGGASPSQGYSQSLSVLIQWYPFIHLVGERHCESESKEHNKNTMHTRTWPQPATEPGLFIMQSFNKTSWE